MMIGLNEKLLERRTRKNQINTIQIKEFQNDGNPKVLLMTYFKDQQLIDLEDQIEDLEVLICEIEYFTMCHEK